MPTLAFPPTSSCVCLFPAAFFCCRVGVILAPATPAPDVQFRGCFAPPHFPALLTWGCCWAGFVFDPVSLAGKWRAVCRASQNSPRLPAKDRRARLCAMGLDQWQMTQFPAPQPTPSYSCFPAPSLLKLRPPGAASHICVHLSGLPT